jgi:hypothetical protein
MNAAPHHEPKTWKTSRLSPGFQKHKLFLTLLCLLAPIFFACGKTKQPAQTAATDKNGALQQHAAHVDWKTELAKAKAGIEKNPRSAFWHNQAGIA